jgi:tetratricopeptide (TPR) repeat protein
MRIRETACAAFFLTFALSAPLWADALEEAEILEQQRQEIFQTQMPLIVESLNLGSFDLFIDSIDRNDFLDRIYGLRLINQRLKREFNERMEFQFEGLIKDGFRDSEGAIDAVLLGVESRGDRGRALVRYNLPALQFSYHEYDLALDKKDRVVILDWIDYLQGDRFTDAVGKQLVMAAPSEAAVRKLIDIQNVQAADLFQLRELLKAARDRQTRRYSEVYAGLDPVLRKQRVVVLQNVLLSKAVGNRRYLREALVEMAQHFPEEPLYSLMLLDYYVPTGKYDEAITGLQRTYAEFGFDDAAMEARLSAITLAKGNAEDAAAYAERAILFEPDLELGWWSALSARVAAQDFAGAVEALQRLEEQHGHTLRAEQLQGDKSFAPLLASDAFKSWAASR